MDRYDETHWYGPNGWPRLRGQVVSLGVELLPAFREALLAPGSNEIAAAQFYASAIVAELGSIVENHWSAMLAAVEEAKVEGEPVVRFNFSSGFWVFALPLFGDVEPLVAALTKDAAKLRGADPDLRPEQALGQIIGQFLEEARREVSPGSAHRLKTWEAVFRAAKKIASAPENKGTPLAVIGSDENVVAVFDYLRAEFSTNKNYPIRKLSTLWAYFEEFHPECRQIAEEHYGRDLTWLAAEQEEALVRTLTGDFCLEELRQRKPDLFEVLAVDAGLDEAKGETKGAYLSRKGIGRATFNNRYEQGAAAIRECFEKNLRYKLLGPQIL